MLFNSYSYEILYQQFHWIYLQGEIKLLLVSVNNRLKFEIEIVHDLSCHPIESSMFTRVNGMPVRPSWSLVSVCCIPCDNLTQVMSLTWCQSLTHTADNHVVVPQDSLQLPYHLTSAPFAYLTSNNCIIINGALTKSWLLQLLTMPATSRLAAYTCRWSSWVMLGDIKLNKNL